eukprot:TRINITY_DN66228_c0_g1_i1.p1 TRINITY_DN66228_c0_g1~~TRINITY_DN66228_c0_g1_i1.p1  ORF type:complete len:329 (+),score=92.02 TRINITY_DN66228_c0_g1_i1:27-989(+)
MAAENRHRFQMDFPPGIHEDHAPPAQDLHELQQQLQQQTQQLRSQLQPREALYTMPASNPPQRRPLPMGPSILSAASSEAGTGDDFNIRTAVTVSTTKVKHLATDIEQLEDRCDFLDQRNRWLTQRLMHHQRAWTERNLLGFDRWLVEESFKAWKAMNKELMLERQLEEQTSSLDACQQLARDLGSAIAREQAARAQAEGASQSLKGDIKQMQQLEADLARKQEEQRAEIERLQRHLREAETCLNGSKRDAQALLEVIVGYESRAKDIAHEVAQEVRYRDDRREPNKPRATVDHIGYSVGVRSEAAATMQRGYDLLRSAA